MSLESIQATTATPPRFERAITWTRLAGAVAVVLVAPFLPNLGPIAIALLAGTLVASAVMLHVLAGRIHTAADARRFSWVTFSWDIVVISFAILLMTPDPMWPLIPLIGTIFIITATFRLGAGGGLIAAGVMAVVVVVIAIWRQMALGLSVSPANMGFVLTMYVLSALIVTSMLREYDRLRGERVELLRQDRERTRILEREREARTAAELAITRLGAAERISESAARHDSVAALLQDALLGIAGTVGARAGAILTVSGDSLIDRATYGLLRRPPSPLPRTADLPDVLEPLATDNIRARTVVPLTVDGTTHGVLYLGFDREQDLGAQDRDLLALIASRLAASLDQTARLEGERVARAAAETEAARSRLLVAAADAATEGADLRARFDRLARLVVPSVADSCAILLLRPDGRLETVALAAGSAERERDMWMVDYRHPRQQDADDPVWAALTTTRVRRIEHIGPDDLARLARGPEHLRMLLDRDVRSWMAVPIVADGRTLGLLELYDDASGRSFSEEHMATARSFASRVAIAAADARRGDTMA